MPGHPIECEVIEKELLTPTILRVCFLPKKLFRYEAGQFLSLVVPSTNGPLFRLYSFASAFEQARENGYEICVKLRSGGKASEYLSNLVVGSSFRARAPYGDFRFLLPKDDRSVCMIGTGTGVGPLKAMLESKQFQKVNPSTLLLIGSPTHEESPFKGNLPTNIETIRCISKETSDTGFSGRVTHFLEQLPLSWNWQKTDFYLCGNQAMISDVEYFLRTLRGVQLNAIHKDVFFSTEPRHSGVSPTASVLLPKKSALLR